MTQKSQCVEKYDGYYFRHANNKLLSAESKEVAAGIQDATIVDYVRLDKDQETVFVEDLESYKWLVMMFEPIKGQPGFSQPVYFQCVLGAPYSFVKNQVDTGAQGVVIKKSNVGFDTLLIMAEPLNNEKLRRDITKDYLDHLRGIADKL